MSRPRFHLAFAVADLEATERFYVGLLGASVGRKADRWIDFDFYDHQITAHLVPGPVPPPPTNPVENHKVPARHFGVILDFPEWEALADKLKNAGVRFLIEPHVRFPGQVGEQATLFFQDPSGNAIEIKAFRDQDQVFKA
ncbi:MAG: VOC family protein [Myxococcales bacterium]|nr:VOC family protein [Myxococcales bacterium]